MPSRLPIAPSFSLVVALTPTRSSERPGDLGDARAHRVAMRIDLGRLGDDGDVEMAHHAAALLHPIDRKRKEPVRGGAAPLLVARRKVHADIAVRQRAEDRVHQRMQRDVRVGMAGELAVMRDLDAAEPDAVTGAVERVDVVADAGAHVAKRGSGVACNAGEILRRGHFHIPALAFEHRHLQSRPFDQCGVVGKILAALLCGAPVRVEQGRVGKSLRRLHRAQRRAIERRLDPALAVDQLDRIGDRKPRHRSAALGRRRDRTADQGLRGERARRVMHQHDVGRGGRQRLEAGPDRPLARCRTGHRRGKIEARRGGSKSGSVVRVDHREHQIDLRMPGEYAQARPHHRGAAQNLVLFGKIKPGPRSAAGCHHHRATRIAIVSPWVYFVTRRL
jgi:hypothetical protein